MYVAQVLSLQEARSHRSRRRCDAARTRSERPAPGAPAATVTGHTEGILTMPMPTHFVAVGGLVMDSQGDVLVG